MNKPEYDFILFEHLYNVENHYKDLNNLAMLLKDAGYKVAIANAFKEKDLCDINGITHIQVDIKCPEEFKHISKNIKVRSCWRNWYYKFKKDIYLYKILKELKQKSHNIYIGSLTYAMPVFFLMLLDKKTRYYMWALRSYTLSKWKESIFCIYSIMSWIYYYYIRNNKNISLFVSNEIIKDEINKIGIEKERLILRPERFIEKINVKDIPNERSKELKLLYIGTLRSSKNVELCVEAIKQLNAIDVKYIIAGRCKSDNKYNDYIKDITNGIPNIIRIDKYLTEEEYKKLIEECDFLVLCDKKEKSCATYGTMTEALLQGKPIIAPNIEPFSSEIQRYEIGRLYNYNDAVSLCKTISSLRTIDYSSIYKNIKDYQRLFLKSRIVEELKKQIC